MHSLDLGKGMSLLGICLDSDNSSLMNYEYLIYWRRLDILKSKGNALLFIVGGIQSMLHGTPGFHR